MANQSVENVKGLFKNKSTRVVVIITVGVIFCSFVIANMSTSNQQARPKELQAAANTVMAPTGSSTPGTSDDALHNQKIRESNQQQAAAASQTGASSMPRLSNSATNSGKDPFDLVTNKPEVAKAPDAPVAPPVRPAGPAPAPVQAAQPVQKSTDLKDAEKNMAAAMVGFLNSWGPSPQRVELNYVNVVPQGVSAGGAGSGNSVGVQSGGAQAAVGGGASDASNGGASTKKVALKAGSILHAVVITSVNSDEAGPVLAQIVAGPYAGGRLIGKFELGKDAEKMTLTFSTLTMQNADKSYAITSFAIDPDTARTALASDVDNHYLSRYGMFAAASFLKGYSKALSTQGTTQTVNAGAAGVSTTTSYPQMNTHDIAITALGEVGSEIAGSLKDGLKRPPTVTLNSGTEIGVLVMTDTTF